MSERQTAHGCRTRSTSGALVVAAAVTCLAACGEPSPTYPDLAMEQGLGSRTFIAIEDAEVREREPQRRFGSLSTFKVDGAPTRWGYVKFDVQNVSGRVTRAQLRCHVMNRTADGPAVFQTSNAWTEKGITWSNRPAVVGEAVDDVGAVSAGTWVTFDVTKLVQSNGIVSFALLPTAGDGLACDSRESSRKPRLVVAWDSPTSSTETETQTETPPSPPSTCQRDLSLPGDSLPCTQLAFPTAAIHGADNRGGRVLDVTKFGANGSDNLDDSAAFIAAYDHVMRELERVGWDGFFQKSNKASFVIYIPDGVYRLSKSIVYSGATRYVPRPDGTPIKTAEASVQLRFIGQSRERTVLELASGTFATSPGAVLAFGKTDFNNTPASNAVRNLTVRVKPNNALATGIYFGGANSADIDNVSVISEDGAGLVGIDNAIGTVVGPQRNITVVGFDYGFRMRPYHFTHPVLEHVTVRGQRLAGIHLVNGTASMRAVQSVNSVPALLLSDAGAHGVMIDSDLGSGAQGQDAIRVLRGAHFFGRNITVTGYGCGVRKGSSCVQSGAVDEYVSDAPIARSSSRPGTARSLAMAIEEPAHRTWASYDVTQWAQPAYASADADAGVDATARLQAAVNSGKPVVYLPAHRYVVNGTITVPCTVKRIEGLFSDIEGSGNPKFRSTGSCADELLIRDLHTHGGVAVMQSSLRPVVLYHLHTRSFLYDSDVPVTAGTPTLFGYMIGSIKSVRPFQNVNAFIRMGSGESTGGTYLVDGPASKVWVMGFKTEKAQATFRVQNGGTLEVLGGILNQYSQEAVSSWDDPDAIAVQIHGASSKLSFVAATNGPSADATGDGFRTLIKDASLSTVRTWAWNDPAIPLREGRHHQEIIPLYVSY